jgi:hypothetical protein
VLNIVIKIGYLAWSNKRVSHHIYTHPITMISMINQIQASITSEPTSKLGEYEENTAEKQRMQIYNIEHKLPLKPSHRDGKHQFPP